MQFYTKKTSILLWNRPSYQNYLYLPAQFRQKSTGQTKANPEALMAIIEPYLEELVITVECMFTWYWASNFCYEHNINHSTRENVLLPFEDPSARRSAQTNIDTIAFYHKQISSAECYIKKNAKLDDYQSFMLLKSIKGIGDVLAMTILYEIHTIRRFPGVQKFASYCGLIKCKAESAGKVYTTSGNKIGNTHLRWTFNESAFLNG